MRRLAPLVLVLVLVVGSRFVSHRRVAVELRLELGARAAELRQADLVVRDNEDRVVGDLHVNTPGGAAPTESRAVRLPRGPLTVGVRLGYASGPDRTVTRTLTVDEPGAYTVDLR